MATRILHTQLESLRYVQPEGIASTCCRKHLLTVATMLLAQTQAPSSASFVRKHRIGGSDYVHVDPKQKGSPVVIAGVSSPSALPSQLRNDWAVRLDQFLAGREAPHAKAILRMDFIKQREKKWKGMRQQKVIDYNEARRMSFLKDHKIRSSEQRLNHLHEREQAYANSIQAHLAQIEEIKRLVKKEEAEKEVIKEQVHETRMELTGHQIDKANSDDLAVGCLLEIGTIDYLQATPRVERPWGKHNDVGQQAWGRAFCKYSRSDCLEDTREKAKGNLIAFSNLGGATSQSFLNLYDSPTICTSDQWVIEMGGASKKINLCHYTRAKYFELSSDPKELQSRFASILGFPFANTKESNGSDADEEDDGLMDSEGGEE